MCSCEVVCVRVCVCVCVCSRRVRRPRHGAITHPSTCLDSVKEGANEGGEGQSDEADTHTHTKASASRHDTTATTVPRQFSSTDASSEEKEPLELKEKEEESVCVNVSVCKAYPPPLDDFNDVNEKDQPASSSASFVSKEKDFNSFQWREKQKKDSRKEIKEAVHSTNTLNASVDGQNLNNLEEEGKEKSEGESEFSDTGTHTFQVCMCVCVFV